MKASLGGNHTMHFIVFGGNAAARSLTHLLLELIERQPDEGRAVLEGSVFESLVAVLLKRSPLVFRA